jgi:hypothetical protein
MDRVVKISASWRPSRVAIFQPIGLSSQILVRGVDQPSSWSGSNGGTGQLKSAQRLEWLNFQRIGIDLDLLVLNAGV